MTTSTPDGAQIEIPALGQVEYATPAAAATFNLLFEQEGSYAIRRNGDKQVATIVVSAPRTGSKNSRGKAGSGS